MTIGYFLIIVNMKKFVFILAMLAMLAMLASCGRGEKISAPSDTIVVADTVAIDSIL